LPEEILTPQLKWIPVNLWTRRVVVCLMATTGLAGSAGAQEQAPNRRDVTIVAENYRFSPDRLEVAQDDLVKVTLRSADEPLTFAIDAYRILKRVGGGQSITFEFRADQPGTFSYYCSMTSNERCREMRGTLVVIRR
jgi:heme/copper-type cytochrome/quinol oxidase subunit 2